jgi:hypothetical protein
MSRFKPILWITSAIVGLPHVLRANINDGCEQPPRTKVESPVDSCHVHKSSRLPGEVDADDGGW